MNDMSWTREKVVKKLKKTIAKLMDIITNLTNRNTELDGQKKKLLHTYYETALQLEDAQDLKILLSRGIRLEAKCLISLVSSIQDSAV